MRFAREIRTNLSATILVLTCLTSLLFGCGKSPEKAQDIKNILTKEKAQKDAEKSIESNADTISLLAIKYKIKPDQAKNFLKEYKTEDEYSFYEVLIGETKDLKKKFDKADFVHRMSSKYKIPEDKLASLIFDYDLYEKSTAKE